MSQQKKLILLLNLGTPEAPTTKALKPYLNQFLMDKFVIDLPKPIRALLVKGIIVPTRAPKSAKAYKTIWTDQGSPLLIYSQELQTKLQQKLGDKYHVELAMRYGNPSTESVVNRINNNIDSYSSIEILPMYPHYAESSSRSAIDETNKHLSPKAKSLSRLTEYFYNKEFYLDALYHQINKNFDKNNFDFLLFSYHGIPERHILKVDSDCKNCLKDLCCNERPVHPRCYRGQCFETTALMVDKLQLNQDQYATSFQSRLGKDPWIKPYTDKFIIELAKKGIKKIAVACPAFTADCLETIEEIGEEAKEDFIEAGGEDLVLIPALNSEDHWVEALANEYK